MMEITYLLFWFVLENLVTLLACVAVLGLCAWLLLRGERK